MRTLRICLASLMVAAWSVAVCGEGAATSEGAVDYTRDIKPILAARCYACHGPLKQENGLRVDTAAALRRGGDGGPAITAHASSESLLITAVTGSDGWQMPPEGEPLSAEQVAKIKAWIDAGAKGPADEKPVADPRAHWAYQPPARSRVPSFGNDLSMRNPIDAFIAAEHQKHGLRPRPEAARHTLLRRVYLDLIGLPPTADELATFLSDAAPDAYERVVDRLLASPHYGERWGRHWMDVWRYSDWYGWAAEVRNSQPHIWRWRDWIVESLNADKGYDRMIVEMLAGDELAPTDPATLRATGYLVRNWYKFNRNTWIDDTVEHTCKAFLATTFNCARCHDHKYDPIRQEDYYHLRAFFEPHQIRTDFVGNLDRKEVGLVRVYDAAPEPTYLFVRGDERQPDKSKTLSPALPPILCPEPLSMEPVAVPLLASHPGLDPALHKALLDHAADEVRQSQAALTAVREKLATARKQSPALAQAAPAVVAASRQPGEEATPGDAEKSAATTNDAPTQESANENDAVVKRLEADVALAEKKCTAALAALIEVQARIAAERAKAAQPADPAANALALAAGQAERRAELERAECKLAEAQQELAEASTAGKDDKAKAKAEARVNEATKELEAARKAVADASPAYTPLDQTYPDTSTGRRLALARWIASAKNPLTARVAVNHMWLRHFGLALVGTTFDFGTSGQLPSHPALLDWLAVEFMEHGWSMKHLHRLIVTSATYRLDSDSAGADDPNLRIDPDNRFLWRARPRRTDAEVIRDSILHLAGALDPVLGGPQLGHRQADQTNRRSIYYCQANEKRVTFLELFDQPGGSEGYQRIESIVPQQALALLNSGFAIGHARTLAEKLWEQTASGAGGRNGDEAIRTRQFVALAFRHILTRDASEEEHAQCQTFLREQAERLAHPERLTAFDGESNAGQKFDAAARARANLMHVLFNHNDFVEVR